MSKERPILFSAPMVRAILEGRKTQTRRLMKPPPPTVEAVRAKAGIAFDIFAPHSMPGTWAVSGPVWAVRELMGVEPGWRCSCGEPGDRLWVRETWAKATDARSTRFREDTLYAADFTDRWRGPAHFDGAWRPSIHMPRWASRISLEITGVRVERVQDISGDDIRAEGIESAEHRAYCTAGCDDLREAWAKLWDGINAKRAPWHSNPWVWVVEFKRLPAEEESKA